MSWGRDLWDQGEHIASHTKKGIEFLERYANFVVERHKIENEYARQLKSLAAKYTPKKREGEDEQFTHRQAFIGVLGELNDLANQHERVAEQFREDVVAEIDQITKKLRNERKENIEDVMRLQSQLEAVTDVMKKAHREYIRAYKESEAAQAKFSKADTDLHLSKADVIKAKNNSIAKTQQAEDAKTNYALQLQKTNEFQREYYTRLLPAALERLRELDETRIKEFSRMMAKCVEIENGVLPIVQRCLDGMLEHTKRADASADSLAVVQKYISGYAMPEDHPFVDLSADGSSTGSAGADVNEVSNGGSTVNGTGSGSSGHYASTGTPTSPGGSGGSQARRGMERKQSGSGAGLTRAHSTKRGKFSNFFKPKVEECFKEDFSDLPPQQQCIRLTKKIDSIQKQIDTKLAQKDGLIKMQNVYRESPKMGDLSQVEVEMQRCESEIAALEAELAKFQKYLREANIHLNVPINVAASGASSNSTSPSSTPRSRGPPPNRPPPPTTSPSFHGGVTSHDGPQRSSTASDGAAIGRSGSENSVVSGNAQSQDAFNKGKAGTPTPQPTHTNGGVNGPSTSASHATLSHNKGALRSSPTGIVNRLSSKLAPRVIAAPVVPTDDYDEWTPVDNCDENIESQPKSATAVVLGTCKALYDFAGDGDGMVPMKEGEEMLLLERDAGDGWTKIRRSTLAEGFVPTSYLDCKWYPD